MEQVDPGQLAAMRAEGFDSAVSSPPYEGSMEKQGGINPLKSNHVGGPHSQMNNSDTRYGQAAGQLGSSSGDDFWSAARTIIEQTYAVLRPGAHAVWVVKHFVRNGALVDFPDQWRQLCEACGFITVHEHHALLVEDHGVHVGFAHIDNGDGTITPQIKRLRKERKSFFRRLAESKGSPRIDHETIYCMVKET